MKVQDFEILKHQLKEHPDNDNDEYEVWILESDAEELLADLNKINSSTWWQIGTNQVTIKISSILQLEEAYIYGIQIHIIVDPDFNHKPRFWRPIGG